MRFCEEYIEERRPVSGGRPSKLSLGDLELLEALKTSQRSLSLGEIWEILEFGIECLQVVDNRGRKLLKSRQRGLQIVYK